MPDQISPARWLRAKAGSDFTTVGGDAWRAQETTSVAPLSRPPSLIRPSSQCPWWAATTPPAIIRSPAGACRRRNHGQPGSYRCRRCSMRPHRPISGAAWCRLSNGRRQRGGGGRGAWRVVSRASTLRFGLPDQLVRWRFQSAGLCCRPRAWTNFTAAAATRWNARSRSIALKNLRGLGQEAGRTLMIGDSSNDALRPAGCPVVLVSYGDTTTASAGPRC